MFENFGDKILDNLFSYITENNSTYPRLKPFIGIENQIELSVLI